jgi:AcrR family transcriptional regulator
MLDLLRPDRAPGRAAPQNRTLDAHLTAAHAVFIARGYANTRVDDLAAAAGISRAAFYRYFKNKDDLARVLTAEAVQSVGRTVTEIPDIAGLDAAAGRSALRRWLARYHSAHVDEAGMLRVWVDAALQHPDLRAESAPLLDWGRRRLARYLEPRGFGDADVEAVVMVALLGVFGARVRPAPEIDAAVHVIARGLLGAPA